MNKYSIGWVGLLLAVMIPMSAGAGERVITVKDSDTPVYSESNDGSTVVLKAKEGQRYKTDGTEENDFYKLVTKSGRALWISKEAVEEPEAQSDDLVVAEEKTVEKKADDFKRLTVDIGGSSNLSNDGAAYEINLGLNYYFYRWLFWRNAPFYRSQTDSDAVYGMDTSIDGEYSLDLAPDFSPHAKVGAGYRFAKDYSDAPFVEGGLGLSVGGMDFGASAKMILNSVMTSGAENETLFSVNLSGGVSF